MSAKFKQIITFNLYSLLYKTQESTTEIAICTVVSNGVRAKQSSRSCSKMAIEYILRDIKMLTEDAISDWLLGEFTTELSIEVRTRLTEITEEAKVAKDITVWEYIKIAEINDRWEKLIGNGFINDITPYAQGIVLEESLQLVAANHLSPELAQKMIVHVW